jgi:hypothetical protein
VLCHQIFHPNHNRGFCVFRPSSKWLNLCCTEWVSISHLIEADFIHAYSERRRFLANYFSHWSRMIIAGLNCHLAQLLTGILSVLSCISIYLLYSIVASLKQMCTADRSLNSLTQLSWITFRNHNIYSWSRKYCFSYLLMSNHVSWTPSSIARSI